MRRFWTALGLALAAVTSARVGAQVLPAYDGGSTGADGAIDISLPPAIDNNALCFDSARGRVVWFGGKAFGTLPGETWEWDGSIWRIMSSGGPDGRNQHALAFDAARAKTVLFGGVSYGGLQQYTDTWTWDGARWTQAATTGPSARRYHGMVYDSARSKVVLFGGEEISTNTTLGDTWEWNGTAWTQVATTGPGPRQQFAMAFDAARNRTVLYGGYGSSYFTDTWEWNGSTWQQKDTVGGPVSGTDRGMAYCSAIGKVVLFDPLPSYQPAEGATWQWSGTAWSPVAAASNPTPRTNYAVAGDTTRNRIVLFGGYSGNVNLGDTWEFDGTTWTERFALDMTSKPDGVFNCTTFRLHSGRLRVRPNASNTPLTILATGDIVIDGELNLDGENGPYQESRPGHEAKGGPGGFPGGLGGKTGSGSLAGGPGQGPGGGGATADSSAAVSNGGGFSSAGTGPDGGLAYGNEFLQPLVGGSGGSGAPSDGFADGGGGGAGGGAVLLASNTRIFVRGRISANGGSGGVIAGSGSAGAIRLVAPEILGSGGVYVLADGGYNLTATAVYSYGGAGSDGRIRTEGYRVSTLYNNGGSRPAAYVAPPSPSRPGNAPTIRVATIGGQSVPAQPTGSLVAADVTFASAGAASIGLATTNVPTGTVLKVRVATRTKSQIVNSSPVTAGGTATANVTVEQGPGTVVAFADLATP